MGDLKKFKKKLQKRERKGYFGLIIEELGGIYIFSWVDEEQGGVHTFGGACNPSVCHESLHFRGNNGHLEKNCIYVSVCFYQIFGCLGPTFGPFLWQQSVTLCQSFLSLLSWLEVHEESYNEVESQNVLSTQWDWTIFYSSVFLLVRNLLNIMVVFKDFFQWKCNKPRSKQKGANNFLLCKYFLNNLLLTVFFQMTLSRLMKILQ